MAKKPRKIGEVSSSVIEDAWQRKATENAIAAARGVTHQGGPIPPATQVGRLSDTEWGWIAAAILFAWIKTRAEQAVSEGLDSDRFVRLLAIAGPSPWDAGAIESILPELANCPDVDWTLPLGKWKREDMVAFLGTALDLIRKANIARDATGRGVTQNSSASTIARQANVAAGGPLMTPDELNDEIKL